MTSTEMPHISNHEKCRLLLKIEHEGGMEGFVGWGWSFILDELNIPEMDTFLDMHSDTPSKKYTRKEIREMNELINDSVAEKLELPDGYEDPEDLNDYDYVFNSSRDEPR